MAGGAEHGSKLIIGTTDAELGLVYPWLDAAAEALRVPETMRHGMHVALQEAVANVAMHGFAPGQPGKIQLCLKTSSRTAELIVADNGQAFDPTRVAIDRAGKARDLEPGGQGLKLMRHFCPDISYARDAGWNRLRLRFPLTETG